RVVLICESRKLPDLSRVSDQARVRREQSGSFRDSHMSTTLAFDEMLRPRLRDDIVFGPPQRRGAATTYLLKDRYTNWFYRVGFKEYFLLSRMDGNKPLRVLNEEYAAAFGRDLNRQSW